MNKKKLVIIVGICFVIVVSAFVVSMIFVKAPLKIAYVGALSGTSSSNGKSVLAGVEMAVEEINQTGGINRSKIELIIKDMTTKDPETVMNEFEEEGVIAIVGLELSSITTSYLPFINEHQIVSITTGASSYILDDIDDYLLRLNPSDNLMMKKYAEYAVDQLSIKSSDVIYTTNNLEYAQSIYNSLGGYFEENGGQIYQVIAFYSNSETNYKTVIEPLIGSDSDAVIIVANDFDTSTIIQQMRLNGINNIVLASAWSRSNDIISYIGDVTEDVYFLSIVDPSPSSDSYNVFQNEYIDIYDNKPNYSAFYGNDSVNPFLVYLFK